MSLTRAAQQIVADFRGEGIETTPGEILAAANAVAERINQIHDGWTSRQVLQDAILDPTCLDALRREIQR